MRAFWVVQILAIFLAPAAIYLYRHRREGRAALRGAALALGAVYGVFFVIMIAGETVTDPGGWRAAALIAAWAVPMTAAGLLAWYRPQWAVPVLATVVVAFVALSLWAAVSPEWWRALEDGVGPVRAVAAFAATIPLALLGWRRPAAAGVLLLTLAVPGAVATLAAGAALGGWGVMLVVSAPAAVMGLLYLLSLTRPIPRAWPRGHVPRRA